tara:strand:- start:143 stop:661 length:519 start_codon:yes stop_codon:yes gene_type:complete
MEMEMKMELEMEMEMVEQGEPPIDPREARAVADDVHQMITFIRQVAEREIASVEKGTLLEDNYALLVKPNGQTVAVKIGRDEVTEAVHVMLSNLTDKCNMILLRRVCHEGSKRQLIIDIESRIGSMQMLLKHEKTDEKPAEIPELRCMHAASRNKWFKSAHPETPAAWFSDC